LKLARLTRQGWQAERDRMLGICQQCHCANFVKNNLENADSMIKAADKIFAEAINIVTGLYKDGIIKRKTIQPTFLYPDLFMFYEVNTHIEELLYEMFMDYRMKTYQAAFHIMPDYTTWYGYAKMKETLIEMKGLSKQMRLEAKMQRK
ncbi:MAG: cytochrome C, partial [Deltaproteobacteria bacterium]